MHLRSARSPTAGGPIGPVRRRAPGPGPDGESPARVAGGCRSVRPRARRRTPGERSDTPRAHRPAVQSGTGRSSTAPTAAPGTDARRPARRARPRAPSGGPTRARRRRVLRPPPDGAPRAGGSAPGRTASYARSASGGPRHRARAARRLAAADAGSPSASARSPSAASRSKRHRSSCSASSAIV